MELYWNGTDITRYVDINGCVFREAAGGRSDSLEMELDRADIWYQWGPEEGDEIEIIRDDWRTGKMYLTAVVPKGESFRVIASSMNPAGVRKAWGFFRNLAFQTLMERCAAEIGMEAKIFGVTDPIMIGRAMRKGEGCGAFLDRIGTREGFKVKAWDGALRAIYLPWAEEQEARTGLVLNDKSLTAKYRRRKNLKYTGARVVSPWASASARDTAAEGNNEKVFTGLPAESSMEAGKWARNLLREMNRRAEEIVIESELNLRMESLARVHVEGGTDMDGEWIVEEAEHDLKETRTCVKMYRVIGTIK